MTALLDTGLLLAVLDASDDLHEICDCAIVAIAERLNVTRILTVDRRHFELFRPQHCAAFEISP